jgi:multimeric flavodoxin WrbA
MAPFIVGINGSPNPEGNCAFLLRLALDQAQELGAKTVIIQVMEALEGQDKPYCDACSTPCDKSCFTGTALEEAFDILLEANGLILASPVYFGTVSAQLKAFWDKTRWIRSEKALVGKPGGAIAVGAARFGGQETTLRTLHDMMLIHGMSIVAEGVKGKDAGHQGVCGVKPVREDTFAQKRAAILGERLYQETTCS